MVVACSCPRSVHKRSRVAHERLGQKPAFWHRLGLCNLQKRQLPVTNNEYHCTVWSRIYKTYHAYFSFNIHEARGARILVTVVTFGAWCCARPKCTRNLLPHDRPSWGVFFMGPYWSDSNLRMRAWLGFSGLGSEVSGLRFIGLGLKVPSCAGAMGHSTGLGCLSSCSSWGFGCFWTLWKLFGRSFGVMPGLTRLPLASRA